MPRYIDEGDIYELFQPTGLTRIHVSQIDELPRADVVPKSEVEDLIYKLECLLCHATGSKLSKHTYDLRTMESAVTDYVEKCCDEARAEANSEVERLEKALAAQGLEYDQALQKKARECNMAIDKIRLEHRAELAKAKQEVAREIIDELLEALQGEVDAEEKLESNDWNYSDTVGYQIHRYAGDKLETLAIALSLYKKKYTEGETDV